MAKKKSVMSCEYRYSLQASSQQRPSSDTQKRHSNTQGLIYKSTIIDDNANSNERSTVMATKGTTATTAAGMGVVTATE